MRLPVSDYSLGLTAYVYKELRHLQNKGIPAKKLTQKSLLRHFVINNPDSYIPTTVIFDFFESIKKHYGPDAFSFGHLKSYQLADMGKCGMYMVSTKRVLPILQNVSKYDWLLCSSNNTKLKIEGKKAFIQNSFVGHSRPGKTICESIWLSMILNLLRSAEVADWNPVKIHFSGNESEFYNEQQNLENTKISYNQDFCGVEFLTTTLSKEVDYQKDYAISKNQLPTPATTISGKIEQLLENMDSAALPLLLETAAYFGVSASTLKRHLTSEGTNYDMILEKWRFMKGVNLLTQTTLKINEISDILYYANAANFTRAFKRWSGKSPKEFRNAC